MTTPLIGTNLNIAYSLDGSTWHYFGYAKNCKLKKSRKTIEVSSPTIGDSECYIPGRKKWSMSTSNLTPADFSAIDQIYEAGTEIYLQMRDLTPDFSLTAKYAYSGKAIIKSLSHDGDIHQMAKTSIELQGTGALAYSTWSEAVTMKIKAVLNSVTGAYNITATIAGGAPCAMTATYGITNNKLAFAKGQTKATCSILVGRGETYDFSKWVCLSKAVANYAVTLTEDTSNTPELAPVIPLSEE